MLTRETFPEFFNSKRFDEIYDQTIQPFQANLSKEAFIKYAKLFSKDAGDVFLKYNNTPTINFHRYCYMNESETLCIIAAFTDNDDIIGIEYHENKSFDKDNIFTQNEYYIPLEEWVVSAGGTDIFHNYHYAHKNQRYAYDLTNMIELYQHNGAAHDVNAYFAFGSDVLAPLDGKVIEVKSDVKDHPIGSVNMNVPPGNYIIIEHDNNEYSMLAHLKYNSVRVNVGDHVNARDIVAQVGNSGATTVPHLHFQVMTRSELNSDSVRINFKDYETIIQGDRYDQ